MSTPNMQFQRTDTPRQTNAVKAVHTAAPKKRNTAATILAILLVIAIAAAGYLGWRSVELSRQLEDMTKQLSVTADALVAKTTEQETTAAKLADTENALAAKTAEQETTAAKLADTENALAAKTAEQEATAAQLSETETALAAKTAEQEATAAQLSETETALAAKTAEQEATAAQLNETETALAAKTAEQEATATQLSETEMALAAKTVEQEATAAQLSETEVALAARTAELKATTVELTALEEEFQTANAVIELTTTKLSEAESALAQKNAELEQLTLQLAESEAKVAELSVKIEQANETLNEALAALSAVMHAKTGHNPSDEIKDPVIGEPDPVLTGDLVSLGHYEQDGDLATTDPIQWRVLKVEGSKAFVVSECILEGRVYHGRKGEVSWANCDLRKWLNGEFLNAAFTKEEQQAVLTTEVDTPAHPDYPISGYAGCQTLDRLFLLSYEEIMEFMPTKNERLADASPWGSETASVSRLNGKPWWWLRTPGASLQNACYISNDSLTGQAGGIKECPVNDMNTLYGTTGGVRPAMWIDLTLLGK